jgi:hypothetical protein
MTDDGLFTYTFDSENRLATVQSNTTSNYGPISMAVDSDLEFTTGGDQSFVRTTAVCTTGIPPVPRSDLQISRPG